MTKYGITYQQTNIFCCKLGIYLSETEEEGKKKSYMTISQSNPAWK